MRPHGDLPQAFLLSRLACAYPCHHQTHTANESRGFDLGFSTSPSHQVMNPTKPHSLWNSQRKPQRQRSKLTDGYRSRHAITLHSPQFPLVVSTQIRCRTERCDASGDGTHIANRPPKRRFAPACSHDPTTHRQSRFCCASSHHPPTAKSPPSSASL